MRISRYLVTLTSILLVVGTSISAATLPALATAGRPHHAKAWAQEGLRGNSRLYNSVAGPSHGVARFVGRRASSAPLTLNFGLPLRNQSQLVALIKHEAKTHIYPTRSWLYAHFSPPVAQFDQVKAYMEREGIAVTHENVDRLAVAGRASTGRIEHDLGVTINNYRSPQGEIFYSANRAPTVPTALGIQAISGLSSYNRFHTDLHMQEEVDTAVVRHVLGARVVKPGFRTPSGYWPSDLRSLYDVTGHTGCEPNPAAQCDGTGQTLGFTLWGTGLSQAALNQLDNQTGDTPAQLDTTNGVVTGDSAGTCVSTVASGPNAGQLCVNVHEGANQLLFILENNNPNNLYNSSAEVEEALDVSAARSMAPNAGLKYYLGPCEEGASTCGVFDTDLEEAISDAADDPTLHTVSNSWGDTADAYNDIPFYDNTNNSFEMAAAAGTTFYFSSGDQGADDDGYPSDDAWVVAVGGSGLYSAPNNSTYSTELTWANDGGGGGAGAGSRCSNEIARPFWQTGTLNGAVCGGRAIPDITADADPETGIFVAYPTASKTITGATWSSGVVTLTTGSGTAPGVGSNIDVNGVTPSGYNGTFTVASSSTTSVTYDLAPNPGTYSSGGVLVRTSTTGVGGTSLAGPIINGMTADAENFIAAQSYPGSTPQIGFTGPVIYQLGNGASYNSYYHNITCGNNAYSGAGPEGANGDNPGPGWSQADGFGTPDWYNWSVGYAQALGATGLSTPASLASSYTWSCSPTAGNTMVKGISCPSSSTCYSIGPTSSSDENEEADDLVYPHATELLPQKSTNGGQSWFPQSADMLAISCSSDSNCVEVGDGGRVRVTTNGGTTWTDGSDPVTKPLYQISCPSASICYAAGDFGNIVKSTNGGLNWTLQQSGDGETIYGLACPSTSVCFTQDVIGYVDSTTNGGSTWSLDTSTPIGNGDLYNPNSTTEWLGTGISCPSTTTCVAVGMDDAAVAAPIMYTTNGGSSWSSATSGTAKNLVQVSCLAGTTTCYAVGASGTILQTTNLTTWTAQTSHTTNQLNQITCVDANDCFAAGSAGTVDALVSGTWTPKTGLGAGGFYDGISCPDTGDCWASGQNGVTIYSSNPQAAVPAYSIQAGGGSTAGMNAISCPSTTECVAVGASGSILETLNGGQTWLPQTSGTTVALNGVSCTSTSTCVAVGSGSASGANQVITSESWTAGTATLNFASSISVPVGGYATVAGACPGGYNGIYPITSSTSNSLSYALASNPGACATSINVTGASWASTSGGQATLTFASTTAPNVGSSIAVSGITPSGYNGTFTVVSSTATSVTYALATNPGTYGSGGSIALSAAGTASIGAPAIVDVSTNANNAAGTTWALQASSTGPGTANGLLSVSCQGSTCSAGDSDGGVDVSTNGGSTWAMATNTVQAAPAITGASYTASTSAAMVTFAPQNVAPAVGTPVTIAGVASAGPGSFNGTFTITASTTTSVSYVLATSPGAYTSGGSATYMAPFGVNGMSCATSSNCVGVQSAATSSVSSISWSSGTATLTFPGLPSAPPVGTDIQVSNIVPQAYDGDFAITASTTTSVSYALATNPGQAVLAVGNAAWESATQPATGATYSTSAHTATVSYPAQSSAVPNGSSITVSGITPTGYDGTFTVTGSTTSSATYSLATNPGTYVSGGTVALPSAVASVDYQYNSTSAPPAGSSVTVAGVNPSGLNGTYTVTGTPTSTTLSFPLASNPGQFSFANGGTVTLNPFGGTVAIPGEILSTSNTGTSFSSQVNPAPGSTLSAVSCGNTVNCTAVGPFGAVVATYDGSTWSQQPDPLSGPLNALNNGSLASTSQGNNLLSVDCVTGVCATGGYQGLLMTQPKQTSINYTGPTSAEDGGNLTVSANLTDSETGAGIDGDTLTFALAPAGADQTCTGVTSGANGTATCTISNVAATAGMRTLQISMPSDGAYPANSSNFSVSVDGDTITYTGPSSAANGGSVTLSATLTDASTGNGIDGETLTFDLAPTATGQTCTGVTSGANGTASCTINPITAPPGSRSVQVSFAGDSSNGYPANSVNAPITITGNSDTITYTGPSSAANGGSVTLSANLTDSNSGAGLDGETLTFDLAPTLTGQTCTGVTSGANGTASCTINPITAPAGSRTVQVSFAGDSSTGYPSNYVNAPITITGNSDNIAYNGPTTATDGQPVTLTGTLTDGSGDPLNGQTLTFDLAPASTGQTCTGVTGGNGNPAGEASCTIASVAAPSGTRTVQVSFAGGGGYPANYLNASITVNAGPPDTLTYTGPTTLTNGSTATLSGTLTSSGTGIDGDTVVFTLAPAQGSAQTCSGVTAGPTGAVSCTITHVNVPSGSRDLRMSFAGDGTYPANQLDTTVTVN